MYRWKFYTHKYPKLILCFCVGGKLHASSINIILQHILHVLSSTVLYSSSAIARTSTKLKLKFDVLFHRTFPTKFMVTLHVCRWGTSIATMGATQCLYQYTCFWSSANSKANFLFFLLLSLSFLFKSPVTVFSSFKSCIAYIHNTKLHGFTCIYITTVYCTNSMLYPHVYTLYTPADTRKQHTCKCSHTQLRYYI